MDSSVHGCLFLDINGAFDNVVPNVLISDLMSVGLLPKVCWFIYQLISCRNIQFVINGGISPVCISDKGVP